ncbi:hypothetical protein [uncultured Sphingomonas sp.]|uniref:hypothetical protein n=1 Tax=uncultured Sphingomonas sp. TaxID=158754 RepID=UPI002587ABF5|nr:hypothetical protein [uncultured Sphingomonas sp.]
MTRAVEALPAVGEPYLQGQLDTLCGIYSAINGLAAVLASVWPLRGSAATTLFRHAIGFVAQRIPLVDAVIDGISPELWLDLIQELARLVKAGPGRAIRIERPFADTPGVRFREVCARIDAALDRGDVVLVSLVGTYDHYTVVRGHTDARYLLHDSISLQSLMKRACGSLRSSRRHLIDPRWVVLLRVVEAVREPP